MNAEQGFGQLYGLLERAQRILVAGHQKPDGDALGASTALYHWLKSQGKDVVLYCKDQPSDKYSYLDHYYDFQTQETLFDQAYDAIVVLDSSTLDYCGIDKFIGRLPAGYTLINVDHHATNTNFGAFNLVMPQASSTSEIIYDFFETNRQPLDAALATSLMTGILYDTTYFSNALTHASSLAAASRLTGAGARLSEIAEGLYRNKSVLSLQLWGAAFSRLKYIPRYNLAMTYFTSEDMTRARFGPAVIDGLANFLSRVCTDSQILLIMTQADENTIKGSLRSNGPDISKIANLLGGSGHKLASGFSLPGRIMETEDGIKII